MLAKLPHLSRVASCRRILDVFVREAVLFCLLFLFLALVRVKHAPVYELILAEFLIENLVVPGSVCHIVLDDELALFFFAEFLGSLDGRCGFLEPVSPKVEESLLLRFCLLLIVGAALQDFLYLGHLHLCYRCQ